MSVVYRFKGFELDLVARELRDRGQVIALQPKVFAVLTLLVEHAGEALGKDDFLEQVWSGRFVTENVLARCIRQLRKILGDDAATPRFIRTVRGHGYQFVAPVEEDSDTCEEKALTRIAVLPFRPLVRDDSNPALELGLTETLVNDLSRLDRLAVRSLAAVRDAVAEGVPADLSALGRKLSVEVIIDGSLQVSGDTLRLLVRALRSGDGTALMSERFDAPLADLFQVQDQLCSAIVQGLLLRLSGDAERAGDRRRIRDLRAYQVYVEGRLKLSEHSVDGARQALEDFQHAVALDPDYVEALIGIAEANDLLGTLGTDAHTYHERTREAARRALNIDPARARAVCCLGKVAWQHDRDWKNAERLLTKATVLDPNDAEAHIALSDYLSHTGRFEKGLQAAEQAGAINPFSPWIQSLIAQALLLSGSVDEALQQARQTVRQSPGFGFARFFLGRCLLEAGQGAEAVEQLKLAIDYSGRDDFIGVLGYALARTGRRAEAEAIRDKMKAALNAGQPVPRVALAILETGLENIDAALRHFEALAENHSWHILLLRVDPAFEVLRARPEGLALLEALQLPPP